MATKYPNYQENILFNISVIISLKFYSLFPWNRFRQKNIDFLVANELKFCFFFLALNRCWLWQCCVTFVQLVQREIVECTEISSLNVRQSTSGNGIKRTTRFFTYFHSFLWYPRKLCILHLYILYMCTNGTLYAKDTFI